MPRKLKSKKTIHVVLDTNALFTEMASDLVSAKTAQMILDNNNHLDLEVKWHLPITVIEERAFQMRKAASRHLPALDKVEKILGHNLGINQSTLNDRIDSIINQNVSSLGINILKIDLDKVDWNALIERAHKRLPPFELDNEKGFRDSLIGESFMQLVGDSPKNSASCRLVMITNDNLLRASLEERLDKSQNAKVLNDLEDLKELINTLASAIDEAEISRLQQKAKPLFFKGNGVNAGLYYSQNILNRIQSEFTAMLEELPEDSDARESSGIVIGGPRFVKKVGQRLHWVSRVIFKFKTFIGDPPEAQGGLMQLSSKGLFETKNSNMNSLPSLLRLGARRQTHIGTSNFDVEWSVTVDSKSKLSRSLIDQINFVGTTLD
jgi:hypothetical protein